MSYSAIVARVYTRPHPNADRLQLGTCLGGCTVIVGMETQDGEFGIYFESDGQLSEEYCKANDLVRRKDPVTGQAAGGYLEENRRVRNLQLRGVRSDGLWMPLSSLAFTGVRSEPKEGDTFVEWHGIPICQKYETPATRNRNAQANKSKKHPRGATLFFPKHPDTPQLRHVLYGIPQPSIVYFTEKLHGTSMRFGRPKEDILLSGWKRWVNKIAPLFPTQEYTYLNGSRNVILEHTTGDGFYGTNDFRNKAVESLELRKGEMLFGELVGYVGGDTTIMSSQPVKDEEAKKRYGATMTYTYGCVSNECRLYIYRIAQANDDGHFVELSWPQLKQRCRELGLNYVPEIPGSPFFLASTDMLSALSDSAESYAQGPSLLDTRHIREGVVLRVESEFGTQWIKHKSWLFKYLEGIEKDKPDSVDIEETS